MFLHNSCRQRINDGNDPTIVADGDDDDNEPEEE